MQVLQIEIFKVGHEVVHLPSSSRLVQSMHTFEVLAKGELILVHDSGLKHAQLFDSVLQSGILCPQSCDLLLKLVNG